MFEVYAEVAGKEIEDSIRREMNGPLEDGLITIGRYYTAASICFKIWRSWDRV